MATRTLMAALHCLSLSVAPVFAQGENRGSLSVTYFQIKVEEVEINVGRVDLGRVDTQTLDLSVSYQLTDRTTVYAGIPFVRKRHKGPLAHKPANIPGREDEPFIDDGKFHSNWQDLVLGISYLAFDSPQFQIEPFASYGTPSHDYPFFGNVDARQNLCG